MSPELRCGVSIYPQDTSDAIGLLGCAGVAMKKAKDLPFTSFAFYDSDTQARNTYLFNMEKELQQAILGGEFQLFYQPKVNIETGKVDSVEALIRWFKEGEMISPADFIPLAEDNDMIIPIGDWVLSQAMKDYKSFFSEYEVSIAVNLSAKHFHHPDLVSSLKLLLQQNNIPTGMLELELTESSLMGNVESAIAVMHELKALGLKLSMDDFGTGYSSLSYLKQFPIDTLKIDRSFIMHMTEEKSDQAIVRAIVSLARELQLSVVAEGVETKEQLQMLQGIGCTYSQGYYYSPPVAIERLRDLL